MTAPSEIDAALKRIESGWRVRLNEYGEWYVQLATAEVPWTVHDDPAEARAEYLRLSAREE
jgi:hypothetical protein